MAEIFSDGTTWKEFWKSVELCTSITNLYVEYPYNLKVEDIQDFATGSNISKLLVYVANQDISVLRSLTSITNLYINANKTYEQDYNWINELINLETLEIVNANFSKTVDLNNLSKLKTLEIKNTLISDISGISKLVGLKRLDLSNDKIVSIFPIYNLVNLEYLNLKNNHLDIWINDPSGQTAGYNIFYLLGDLNYANTDNLTYKDKHGMLKELYITGNLNINDYSILKSYSWTNKDF